MTRKWKDRLIVISLAIVILLVIGMLSGLISPVSLEKKRNEDNLIEVKDILLESGKDSTTELEIDVDEDGVIKLKGTATESAELAYAKVQLDVGTYELTGAPDGSKKTYYLYLMVDEVVYRSDTSDEIVITSDLAGEYTVYLAIVEDANMGFTGEKLYPVLAPTGDNVDFYE